MGLVGKLIELNLPCMLTEMELQSRSMALAETVLQKDAVARDKKDAMKEFNDQITGLDERQRQLVDAMKSGIERRMVSCHVLFHMPQEGTKRIVRTDTGEMVKEEAMTAAECQLHMFAAMQEFQNFMKDQSEPAAGEWATLADEPPDQADDGPPRPPEKPRPQ